jgi:hypothetical protein
MTAILALLSTGLGKALVAVLAGLVAIASAYLKGRRDKGKSAELEQKAKEAEARANEIDRIKRAAGAAPSGGVSVDPNNRDNQP